MRSIKIRVDIFADEILTSLFLVLIIDSALRRLRIKATFYEKISAIKQGK